MGIKRAYEALTAPKQTDRQFLIDFMARRLAKRGGVKRPLPRIETVYHMIAILLRWGFITTQEMPNLSLDAMGNLAEDTLDAWRIINMENV